MKTHIVPFSDVSDVSLLQSAVAKLKWDVDVSAIVTGDDPLGKEVLFNNTIEAVERGAFGVPRYLIANVIGGGL